MKSEKKAPAKKVAKAVPAARKPVAAKAAPVVAKKAAPAVAKKAAPAVAAKPAAKKPAISPEVRYRMIQDAAYYIAERHGFNGDSAYFWSLAEAEINARLGE